MNSQIVSGARSREQAALVFNLAAKMIALSPDLSKLIQNRSVWQATDRVGAQR
ncbi:phage terminase family protein [Sphingomonas sp. WKB10]|nr:phage terminase family protein [Sphingomonas sp. WKB10]